MLMKKTREFDLLVYLTLIMAVTLSGCDPATETAGSVPKALFMIVDGIPADVIETVDTPHLDEIAAGGGYTRAYVGGTVGEDSETPTVSAPGYSSLITGTWSNAEDQVWMAHFASAEIW